MTLHASSVMLVSGGGRGITARCVIELAHTYRCRFVLLGRTPIDQPEPAWAHGCEDHSILQQRLIAELQRQNQKPTPMLLKNTLSHIKAQREIESTLRAVEAAGGQALYLNVDVSDLETLRHQIPAAQQPFGPITAILHGAGNLADKRIEDKTAADFNYVYQAKVEGLLNLLEVIPPQQLTHLILFSSAAGFFGNIGQSDYAMANEILNKIAHQVQQQVPACRVLSLNWGPWNSGMVTPAVRAILEQRNIDIIPLDVGAQMLIQALETDQVQVLIGSMGTPPTSLDAPLKRHHILRHLSLEGNPFLAHHMIGGQAVLPIVHATAWMATTCEQQYPGYRFHRGQDIRVLKGIVFDEELADVYRVDLTEVSKDEDSIVLDVLIGSQTPNGKARYHYKSRATLVRTMPEAPRIALDYHFDDPTVIDGPLLYENGTLFHGPYFQGIEKVIRLSREEVVVVGRVVDVPFEAQGLFAAQSFDPFQTDIQLQIMLISARHLFNAASLPLGVEDGIHYRNPQIGERYFSRLTVKPGSSESTLVADITTHDEQGFVFSQLVNASVIISPQLNHLFMAQVR